MSQPRLELVDPGASRRVPRRLAGSAAASLRAAIAPYLVARVIVVGSLALAHFLVDGFHLLGTRAASASHAGLLAWDASWYERIAEVGYGAAGRPSLRFFPLYPLLGRLFGGLGIPTGAALVLLANLFAFGALAGLHALVRREALGEGVAERAIWFLALWPAAFVLVMGYSEALLLVLSIGAFACWRSGRWWWSVPLGLLAGLCRPVGVLLAVPALVEAISRWRADGRPAPRALAAELSAVAAAPAGALCYLGWVGATTGHFFEPLTEQLSKVHRGVASDPIVTIAHDAWDLAHGVHLGTAMHALFAVAFVVLTVYCFMKLPAAYGWYAAATMAVALTAPNLDSLERYGLACFPLVIALGCLARRRLSFFVLLSGTAAALGAFALLAFVGLYVP